MLRILLERWKQGARTDAFPAADPRLPDRFRGLPVVDSSRCRSGCRDCVEACPTRAITVKGGPAEGGGHAEGGHSDAPRLALDLGRCLFCNDCVQACPEGAIAYTREWRMATRGRADLEVSDGNGPKLAAALDARARRVFGRSLALRVVSAGGCNGCESEVNVLSTVVFDLARFGIRFVASPRHADGLLITGPLTRNMELAVKKTWDAVPSPKFVVALGACAISGGPYVDHPEVMNGAGALLPVDLHVPGCPPHPFTILDGLLRLLGRIEGAR
jgi:Ni,Fe-hydrogenase III small subunit/formate hydrogenlyase subunit 6/NADH:ubiquinone oxidoreductase subunit I